MGAEQMRERCEPGRRFNKPWCCTHDLPLVCAGAPVGGTESNKERVIPLPSNGEPGERVPWPREPGEKITFMVQEAPPQQESDVERHLQTILQRDQRIRELEAEVAALRAPVAEPSGGSAMQEAFVPLTCPMCLRPGAVSLVPQPGFTASAGATPAQEREDEAWLEPGEMQRRFQERVRADLPAALEGIAASRVGYLAHGECFVLREAAERISALAAGLCWALDMLDAYDERLVALGEPAELVNSATHLAGKAKARGVLAGAPDPVAAHLRAPAAQAQGSEGLEPGSHGPFVRVGAVESVECPACLFRFGAAHVNDEPGHPEYTCGCCGYSAAALRTPTEGAQHG